MSEVSNATDPLSDNQPERDGSWSASTYAGVPRWSVGQLIARAHRSMKLGDHVRSIENRILVGVNDYSWDSVTLATRPSR